MPDLESQLAALAPLIEWPPTPNPLPTSAGAPMRSMGTVRAAPERRPWRQLALAAAAVLAIAAALLAIPPTRDAIAGWVNLHVLIHRVNSTPPTPSPNSTLGEGLGTRTTLDGAQRDVTWHIAVPASLASAAEVYYQAPPTGPSQGEVSLLYTARPILITEARGRVEEQFFGKMLGPDTTLEDVAVAGHQGYWISGQPHTFFFIDADGAVRNETLRLATNTLIFEDNGTIVRIEGNLTKDEALRIATSMT